VGFSQLLSAIKGRFLGQSLILPAANVRVVIILAGSNQNCPSVAPSPPGGF
jgi:hypothetical protein